MPFSFASTLPWTVSGGKSPVSGSRSPAGTPVRTAIPSSTVRMG